MFVCVRPSAFLVCCQNPDTRVVHLSGALIYMRSNWVPDERTGIRMTHIFDPSSGRDVASF